VDEELWLLDMWIKCDKFETGAAMEEYWTGVALVSEEYRRVDIHR
jgi:hypothetical protein